MTTRRAFQFEADLDISDVSAGLRRIEMQSRRAGAAVGRVGSGLGRGARGAGGVVGRGAGLGAGAAIFEQLIMKIFELFEGTPVLEEFIEALDEIFKAAGPVIGILLKALTPVIKALTPAIEPLARAMVPLVELFGAGLLIAVQLITPAIVLFARGLEKVTTFIRNTVLTAFRFIVDQLNKLPFVDIQVDLNATAGSFDAMAVQIETAGAMADTAAGQTNMLATATGTAGTMAETAAGQTAALGTATATAGTKAGTAAGQTAALGTATAMAGMQAGTATTAADQLAEATRLEAAAADKAKIAADLWAQAARENEAAARPLTTQLGALSDEMDEAYTATDSLGVIIGRTVPQVSALTTEYIMQNMAARPLSRTMGILSDEMDEAYTATDNLGVIIGASKGPAVDLANAIDQMTMDIEDAQKAADLNQAAFDALTPALQAAAIELGIFREEIEEVEKTVETAVMGLGRAAISIGGGGGGGGGGSFSSGFGSSVADIFDFDAIDQTRGQGGSVGFSQDVTDALKEASRLVTESGGTIPLQATAEAILETNRAAEKLTDTLVGNTLVDALNEVRQLSDEWEETLATSFVNSMNAAALTTDNWAGALATTFVDSMNDAALTTSNWVDSLNTVRQLGDEWNETLHGTADASFAGIQALAGWTEQLDAGMDPISDLNQLLLKMTKTITDTAAAAELQDMAIALLPPGLRALAEEFGLFGLSLQEIVDDLPPLGSLTNRQAAFDTRLSPAERRRAGEFAVFGTNGPVNVIIDGAAVATATTQAESEGAM